MKGIDEAIAKNVDLMTYYSELSKKLAKKDTNAISKEGSSDGVPFYFHKAASEKSGAL